MDIEKYSEIGPQFYATEIPGLLNKYLEQDNWQSYLDCGCGDGSLLYALKVNGFLKRKNIFAIDLSKNRINLVKKIDSSINAFVDSAEELKAIKNESIDFLVSTQVIEHVDDKKMINEIYRVLKNDGIAYLSTVHKKWYGWYFYRNNGKWVLDPTHLREYSDDRQLFNLIAKDKFERGCPTFIKSQFLTAPIISSTITPTAGPSIRIILNKTSTRPIIK
jgi:2-polyprenyl-3-methyl-5-hydroxy-6-metoxy-1,4-benzoquinol methylase